MRYQCSLTVLSEVYAICRLDADCDIPDWAMGGSFTSLTRTADELSIVCEHDRVPSGVRCERGWRCLKVEGPLDFSLVGILSSLVQPLTVAGISVCAISTFDTDYLFIRQSNLDKAIQVLVQEGHSVRSL